MKEEDSSSKRFSVPHGKELEDILREAGRRARLLHKKLGNPIATWQNDKVVIIPPEEIPVDDAPDLMEKPVL